MTDNINYKYNFGFSLIEILVSMGIFIFLIAMAGDFVITGFKSISFGSEQETAIQNARKALESVGRDLREAKTSDRGDYALLTAEEQNLIWFGDVDNDNNAEQIRYYLSSSTLYRTIIEPGSSNDYTGTSTTNIIANYVNNQTEPIFVFYSDNNATTSLINEITLININLKINVTPERAPADVYVQTDIQLRNLKDNL